MGRQAYSYDLGEGFSDLGRSGRQALLGLAKWRQESEQERKDAEYLDWLTGQVGGAQDRAVPQASASAPIPQVADLGIGMSDTTAAPQNTLPGPSADDLLTARKAAADDLFASPEQTMNLLIEAKRRQVSPNMGSLLEFITTLHKERATAAESDKKERARADLAMKREAARATAADVRTRALERLAEARNKTARDVAGIHAGASRYATDHRGLKPGDQDLESLSLDDLHALKDSLSGDESELSQPDRAHYDAYDPLSLTQFREDYKSYDDTRNEIRKTLRKIDAEITLRERAQGGGQGAQSPAPKPSPAPAPATGRSYASKQEILSAKARGEIMAGQKVQTPYGIVTVP